MNMPLRDELAAIKQFFLHARMCHDWGFSKLFEHIHHEIEEETQHANALIKNLLFLENIPDLSKWDPLNVYGKVTQILKTTFNWDTR